MNRNLMRSPALAIGWSLWMRHRAVNAAVLTTIPLCALLYRGFLAMIPERPTEGRDFLNELPLTIFPMALSLVWVLYVCAQTENDERKGFTGFPNRMFALPLRTGFLVTCHMAYGIAAMLLVHLAWAWLVFAPVGVRLEMRWPLLLSAGAMMLFQAGVWGLASFPWLRAVLLGVGGLLIGPLLAAASIPGFDWSGHERVYALTTLTALPLVWRAAIVAVTGERCGGWQPWTPVRRFAHGVYDAVFLRRRAFGSPEQALAWLEWRRKGWWLILALALTIAGSVLMLPVEALMGGVRGDLPPWCALILTLFLPLFMGASLGGLLARPDLSRDLTMSPFHAIKPISSGQIVLIKLKVAAGAIVTGGLLAAPLVLAITVWPNWRELWLNQEAQELTRWLRGDGPGLWWLAGVVLVTLVMTWHGMVESIALGLTGRARVIGWLSALRLLCLPAMASAVLWWYRRPDLLARVQPWLYAGLTLLMVWKLTRLVRSFSEVHRRALWTPGQFRGGLALWFLVAATLVVGAVLCGWKLPLPTPLLLLAAAWFWPSGEIAQGVVNLADNRHR